MKHLRIIAKNIALKRCLTLAHSNLRLYICITLNEQRLSLVSWSGSSVG